MEIITRLNWVDVLVVIIMLRISYVAFRDGLSHEIFPLIGSVCSVIISLYYYDKIAYVISQKMAGVSPKALNCISFIALVVVVGIIIKLVKAVTDKIIKVTWHPAIERIGGLLAGVARASVVTSIVLIAIALVGLPYLQRSIKERSLTGMTFLRVGPTIYAKAAGIFPKLQPEGIGPISNIFVDTVTAEKRSAVKAAK